MKVVLSRKGVDSGNSKISSLIFNDKDFIVFPIKDEKSDKSYGDIKLYDDLWQKIYKIKDYETEINPNKKCHLDPNIQNFLQNEENFIGMLGLNSNSITQFINNKIEIAIGDIFLFWGLFSKVKENNQNFYIDNFFKNRHIIYGFLEVGDIIDTKQLTKEDRTNYENKYPCLKNHPHWNLDNYKNKKNNIIYIAKQNGYGMFKYNDELILSAPQSYNRSNWQISQLANCKIQNMQSKSFDENGRITINGHGQEFVLEDKNAEIWAKNLIQKFKI